MITLKIIIKLKLKIFEYKILFFFNFRSIYMSRDCDRTVEYERNGETRHHQFIPNRYK
jgi:hypothetical protein